MDIGSKLKEARESNNFTQEQIAEKLNVSRQTISNWENCRSYPDILNVIELSNIYSLSLDELIKGDENMINHIENTTNIVKAKNKQTKIIELSTFLVVWIVGILFFYLFMPRGDEMAFGLIYIYTALPIASVITSIFIGRDLDWGKSKWIMPFVFGITVFLSGYLTFDLSAMINLRKFIAPDFVNNVIFFLLGAVPSYIAMALSYVIAITKKDKG